MDGSSNPNYVIAEMFFQKQLPCFNEETASPKTRNDNLNPRIPEFEKLIDSVAPLLVFP
jgi:hypothetical protein